jgi:hypothetical protein
VNLPRATPSTPGQNHSSVQTGYGQGHLLVWLLVAIGLYVLSTGPVIKIARRTKSTPLANGIMGLYYPLGSLADHSRVASNFFDWYVMKLWGADA